MLEKVVFWASVVAIGIAIKFLFLSWILFGAAFLIFFVIYYSLRIWRWRYISELSPEANKMLKRYGHFYHIDMDWQDLSDACGKCARAVFYLAVIGCFKAFWWGIPLGLVYFLILDHISKRLNHSQFLVDYEDVVHHDEILNYLDKRAERIEEENQKAA